jgi:hypothetical protein
MCLYHLRSILHCPVIVCCGWHQLRDTASVVMVIMLFLIKMVGVDLEIISNISKHRVLFTDT